MKNLRRPLKSLGQNFLVDRNVVARIVESANLLPGERVLEIGPGRGALTGHLDQVAGELLLVEYDHALAAEHAARYAGDGRVRVVDGDILAVDLEGLLGGEGEKWKVIANLPYNISTQVLFRLDEIRHRFSRLVLMLQKEVVDRLVAPPNCSDYGVTTVLLGLNFSMRREFIVPPGCFNPPPKVHSAVMSLVPRDVPLVDVGDERLFRRLVKASFAMRRKTLSNCLKGAELPFPGPVEVVLEECGIDGRRRGETLSLEEFAVISRRLSELPQ